MNKRPTDCEQKKKKNYDINLQWWLAHNAQRTQIIFHSSTKKMIKEREDTKQNSQIDWLIVQLMRQCDSDKSFISLAKVSIRKSCMTLVLHVSCHNINILNSFWWYKITAFTAPQPHNELSSIVRQLVKAFLLNQNDDNVEKKKKRPKTNSLPKK